MNRPYGVRPKPCEIQGCHAPHVVHGGVKSSEFKGKNYELRVMSYEFLA